MALEVVDWGEALSIVAGGLIVVFSIMIILALTTQLIGKIFGENNKKD